MSAPSPHATPGPRGASGRRVRYALLTLALIAMTTVLCVAAASIGEMKRARLDVTATRAHSLSPRVRALLAGLEERAIHDCLAERIRATPGAKTLVATLAALGTRTVLVTGGFHHFADPVAEMLGFHRVVGNRLAVADGKLTGGLVGPITDSAVKAAVLREELAMLGEGAHSLATGDGANDIPMIEAATYGFAYRAKPKARAAANGRVDLEDLTAVLTLLGVPATAWREG